MFIFPTGFLAARATERVDAPANTALPLVSGSAVVGVTLQTSNGGWSNSPTGYGYQWLRGGAEIAGATASSYRVAAADIGYTLSCRITATNAGGSATATSAATAAVQDGIPVCTALPSISGVAAVGSKLTGATGSWSNTPTSYSLQWLRDGSPISGATGATYTLTSADVGSTITYRVAASNGNGSATATSDPTDTIVYPAPVNVDLPTISGTAAIGNTLTVSRGTWNNSPTGYSYQWRRGSTSTGATGTSYAVTEADIGYTISCRVTATNAGGSATVTATAGTVGGQSPANTSAPYITGTAAVGNTLTANRGSWSGSPTGYAYQWQRGTSAISGATGATYTVTSADAGYTIRCRIVATNGYGSTTAYTDSTATVPQPAVVPVMATAPTIQGTTGVGDTLTAHPGTWIGSPTSYRYEWLRLGGAGGTKVVSTSTSYTLQSADAGGNIYLTVWARNAAGESAGADASNNGLAIAALTAPANTSAPRISASVLGNVYSEHVCSTGSWSGSSITYDYMWQSRVSAGANWANLASSPGNTPRYTPGSTAAGNTIRCRVTAKNAQGSTVAYSQEILLTD